MPSIGASAIIDEAVVQIAGQSVQPVPVTLLGQNMEAIDAHLCVLTNNRLDNPHFVGPADGMTGLASPWKSIGANMGTLHCELTPGMSLSGHESQQLHHYCNQRPSGIVQKGVWLRAGEKLEVEMWAKVRHQPVELAISIGPLGSSRERYDEAKVTIDAAYWKPYRFELTSPCDDDNAAVMIMMWRAGTVQIDQMHLRPAGGGVVRQEMIDRLASLRMPVLRFPGGCISTNYRWRLGTGPAHLRPMMADPVFKTRTHYDFGTDEYLDLCLEQNIMPHITVTLGSAPVEEAQAWAEYCADYFRKRTGDVPPAYWQIGNENYGAWETSHMTGEMYVEALREFTPRLRRACPGCRIVALGEPLCDTLEGEPTPWRDVVLDHAADCFDVLVINRYKGQWRDDATERMINSADSVLKVTRDLREMIDALDKRGLSDKTIGLTEWNYFLQTSGWAGPEFVEPVSVQHAMYVAGVINETARLAPRMELSNFYALFSNGFGMFKTRGSEIIETDVADVYRMYRPAFPGRLAATTVKSPPLGDGDAIDALALDNDEGRWLLLANRSAQASVSVSLAGFGDGRPQVVALSSDDPQARLAPIDLAVDDRAIVLPPLTLARLHWPVG